MVKVYSIDGLTPVVHPEAYVHPSAVLIGDVHVGAGVYIGPSASLRGDFGRLVIEAGANIQDGCVVHGFPESDTVIEEDGHVGHGAIIHSARICRNALIGMGAVVNDNAVVGESAFVAAMAFVKAGMKVPPRARRSSGSPRTRRPSWCAPTSIIARVPARSAASTTRRCRVVPTTATAPRASRSPARS